MTEQITNIRIYILCKSSDILYEKINKQLQILFPPKTLKIFTRLKAKNYLNCLNFIEFLLILAIACAIINYMKIGVVCPINDKILTVAQAATYLQVLDKTILK